MNLQYRKLTNADQSAVEAFLFQQVETSLFMLSNMRQTGLEYSGEPYSGDYFAAMSPDGGIDGVLAHFGTGGIMMQSLSPDTLSGLIALFRQTVERPVTGIIGESEQARQVINELQLTEADYLVNMDDDLFSLTLDQLTMPPVSGSNVNVVAITEAHRTVLSAWLKAYNIEALGAEDEESLNKTVEHTIGRFLRGDTANLLTVEGEPVSLSGFNAQLPEIVQIGPVWTPPEHRNKGYARLLLAQRLVVAKERGVKTAILFTNNPSAARAYEAIGFQKTGQYRLALLRGEVSL